MQLIDTHVHLTYPQYGSLSQVIHRAEAQGVTRYVVPGLDLASSQEALALGEVYPGIIPAVGLHPLHAHEPLDSFRVLAHDPCMKAIGEVGTDRKAGPMESQLERLGYFVELALEVKKPLLVHIRDTWDETLRFLQTYPLEGKVVIHCFTGTKAEIEQIASAGYLISVTALLARDSMAATQEVIRTWPLEKLMLETDGPYLNWPGEEGPNEPATVRKVAEFVAQLKGVSLDRVAEVTTQTAETFFKL